MSFIRHRTENPSPSVTRPLSPHTTSDIGDEKRPQGREDHMVDQIDEKVIELPRLTRFEDTYLDCLDFGIEGCIAEWMEFAFDDDRCKMAPDEKDRLIASLHARLSVALHEAVEANPMLHELLTRDEQVSF
jgi:hypothetical protein